METPKCPLMNELINKNTMGYYSTLKRNEGLKVECVMLSKVICSQKNRYYMTLII